MAAKDLAIALVALANAEGGTVVVGLNDGRVEGVRHHANRVNALRQAAIDHTRPPVRTRFEQVRCRNEVGETDTVLVARVEPGEVVHEMKNGDCYLRVGDESRRLGFTQRQELHYDRGSSPYDGQPVPGTTIDDLDHEGLATYRAAAGSTGTYTRLLRSRSLLTHDGAVTVAGYLLFATHPQDRFPHAHVRVLEVRAAASRYRGTPQPRRRPRPPHRWPLTGDDRERGRRHRGMDPPSTRLRWSGRSDKDPRASWTLPGE